MLIKELKDQNIWNNFVKQNGEYSAFLHSWQWGEFQESLGRKIWRLGVFGEGGTAPLRAAAMVIKRQLPAGKSYLYIPRGPITISNFQFPISNLIEKIDSFFRNEKPIFLRIEPLNQFPISNFQFPIKQVNSLQPQHTLILDLTKSEEELLRAMRQKTRYNIRLAERRGVAVRFSREEKDLESFLNLLKITAERDQFRSHPRNHYQKMLKALGEEMLQLAIAEFEGKILAANLVMFFGHTATYLHGASASEYRNLMAPHLLQWETIKRAKAKGFKHYDFWGVASLETRDKRQETRHPWEGITRFKKGFGGREVSYSGTYDIIFNSFWYWLYKVVKKIR